jgi:hypothetical protein
MKRAIVIILIMILVAGGGAGGLIMLGIVPNPFNPKIEVSMTAAERAAAELEERNKFKPPRAAYVLVKMDDMVVPVIIDGQVQRRVLLIARLMASAASDKDIVAANMNRFQDAVLNDLVPYFQNYFTTHDMVDAAAVKARLVKNAKAVFGERIQDVLLINVFEQGNGRPQ